MDDAIGRATRDIEKLIEAYTRRLHQLQLRVALEGRDARPADKIEIEDIEQELDTLRQQRTALVGSPETAAPATAELQQKRAEVESRGSEPFEVKVAFANREAELRDILSPFGKPFIFVSAPAGYGKTYLLNEVQRRLESYPQEKWLILRHEATQEDTDITVLTGLAAGSHIRSMDDFLRQINRMLEHAGADNLALLFDGVERWKQNDREAVLWLPAAQFAQGQLVNILYEALRFGGRRLKVIFTGRYIDDFSENFLMPYQELSLSPFDLQITYMFIQETLQRFEDVRGKKLGYILEDIQYMAEELLEFTGGHPRAVIRLIQDIGKSDFSVNLRYYFRQERKVELFNDFVAEEINHLLKDIPLWLQEVFRILSIFRGFNGDTLNALLDRGYLARSVHKDGWELFSRILSTHLVVMSGALARDKILQRVLDTHLRFNQPEEYCELHSFAAWLYDQWLQGQNHQGHRLDSGEPYGTDQIQFMVESLYHTARSMAAHAGQGELLLAKIETYLPQLRYPGGAGQGRRALYRAIEDDEQLPNLLKRALGQDEYKRCMNLIINGGA